MEANSIMASNAPPRFGSFITSLIVMDMKNVARNQLLILLSVSPLIVAFVYRFLVPDEDVLANLANEHLGPDLEFMRPLLTVALTNIHAVLMAIFVGLSASMIGAVYGLLLVEEREDKLMASLRVMPVHFFTYIIARMILPIIIAVIVTTMSYPITGMAPLPFPVIFAIAAIGATFVPVTTLGVAAFAPGRVSALALVRLFSFAAILPVIAWFISPPMEWLFAPLGPYWQMRALWSAMAGGPIWLDLIIAAFVNGGMALLFYWIFTRRNE